MDLADRIARTPEPGFLDNQFLIAMPGMKDERFARTVGVRPMEYLLTWRMAVAKDLLRSGRIAMDEVARRVGYGSASTFSTAFSRREGMPPGRFMRDASASP